MRRGSVNTMPTVTSHCCLAAWGNSELNSTEEITFNLRSQSQKLHGASKVRGWEMLWNSARQINTRVKQTSDDVVARSLAQAGWRQKNDMMAYKTWIAKNWGQGQKSLKQSIGRKSRYITAKKDERTLWVRVCRCLEPKV